jgi:Uncharacterised protein family UPF0547
MAAAGQNFNKTITVAETPDAVSQALIAAGSGVSGYTLTTAGTGSIVFTRKYTPTWAVVVGVIGLILFLVGLIALLYKNTETLTITLTPVEGGARVVISGVATHELITRISSALSAMPALAATAETVEPAAASDTKTCPACAETVKAAARVCRFCGHQFEDAASPATT